MTVPLSILDLAPISEGADAATALRNTVDLAQHAEQWGYKRYWVAEHHFVAVASAQPAVLIGQIAAATNTIRVGAAAVQLGQTTAVAVVESFGMLDAFHPGRIDLGVGRSGQRRREAIEPRHAKAEARRKEWRDIDGVVVPPPFDISALMRNPRLRAKMSVLQQPEAVAPDFADQVGDILAMLDGSYRIAIRTAVDAHATPGEGAALTPWVFGSSKGQSAQVAGARGLPFVASYHITPATALDAIDVYRAAFQPSAALAAAVRGGVRGRRGRRRHRDRTAPGVQLRALGVLDPRGRRSHPVSGSRHRRTALRRATGGREGPHRNAIRRRSRRGRRASWRRCSASPTPTSWSSPPSRTVTPTGCDSHELLAKRWGL